MTVGCLVEDSAAVPLDMPHAHTWNAQCQSEQCESRCWGSAGVGVQLELWGGVGRCDSGSIHLIIPHRSTAKTQIAHTGRQHCFRNESLLLGELEVAIVLIPR